MTTVNVEHGEAHDNYDSQLICQQDTHQAIFLHKSRLTFSALSLCIVCLVRGQWDCSYICSKTHYSEQILMCEFIQCIGRF